MSDYPEYERRMNDWCAIVDACDHENARFGFSYNGSEHLCCVACSRSARPVREAAEAALKRERRAVLDSMPRCDYCNRRASWQFPFGVSVCGLHKKRILIGHSRTFSGSGILGMMAIPSKDDIESWATG